MTSVSGSVSWTLRQSFEKLSWDHRRALGGLFKKMQYYFTKGRRVINSSRFIWGEQSLLHASNSKAWCIIVCWYCWSLLMGHIRSKQQDPYYQLWPHHQCCSDGVSSWKSKTETKTETWPSEIETETETRLSEIKTTPSETETFRIRDQDRDRDLIY